MELQTIYELIQTLAAYTACVCLAPYIVLHHYLQGKNLSEKFIICVLTGNFYIVNIVFVVFFLHIPSRLGLTLFTVVPAVIGWLRINQPNVRGFFSLLYTSFSRLLLGETHIKTLLANLLLQPKKLLQSWRHSIFSHTLSHFPDWILLLGMLGFDIYYYSFQTVTKYVYGASDIIVHHNWINAMDEGTIFGYGIYPFGFHNVIWFLHKIFGLQTVSILRVFGVVETIFIYLMIYLLLRIICRSRYLPILGVFLFTLPNLFNFQATMRYQWALPQEFAMLFLYPCAYFLIQFFQRKREELEMKKALLEQNKLYTWLTQYHIMPSTKSLILFGMSFSLTLAVHFYITIIAVLLCAAIAIAYVPIVFYPRYFFSIALAGILSLCCAAAPMVLAYAQGTDLQGSLGWALEVMSSSSSDAEDDTPAADTAANEAVSGENTTDTDTSAAPKESKKKDSSDNVTEDTKTDLPLSKRLIRALQQTVSIAQNAYQKLLYNNDRINNFLCGTYTDENFIVWFIRITEGFTVFTALMVLLRKKFYYRNLLSISLYMLFMILLLCASLFGLPALMDSARARIFAAYATPVMLACFADMIYVILCKLFRYHWTTQLLPIALTIVLTVLTITSHFVKPLNIVYSLQASGEMKCNYEIMKNYPEKKWTIVTTTNSLAIVTDKGWHMEVCTFLDKMQHYTKQTQLTIPTKYVFFYIEKTPLSYGAFDSVTQDLPNQGYVSETAAAEDASYSGGAVYETENRYKLESKLFYWAKAFEQKYPNEFQVYYEDESFICYRITQNEYRLYNFAIDYGFNS
jgi:hypothetical protein